MRRAAAGLERFQQDQHLIAIMSQRAPLPARMITLLRRGLKLCHAPETPCDFGLIINPVGAQRQRITGEGPVELTRVAVAHRGGRWHGGGIHAPNLLQTGGKATPFCNAEFQ